MGWDRRQDGSGERVSRRKSSSAISEAVSHGDPTMIANRYQVLSRLGRGGMGFVYHVEDTVSGGQYALKQLSPRKGGELSASAVQLFEREYHTLKELAHPRVVRADDYGYQGSDPFYTMELLDGGDLHGLAPLPWQQVCMLAYEVCSVLSLLHSRRLLHRDLTPRNIRLTRGGKAKLIDLGLVCPMGASPAVAGTPPYMAPEHADGVSLDGRSDLFSLGCVLYYALTGCVAFPGRRISDMPRLWRISPVAIGSLQPDVPEGLERFVTALMRIEPGSRPRTAAEAMQRLLPLLGSPPDDELEAAKAYLSTPVLVGRSGQQARMRKLLIAARNGRGGGLVITGAPGSGRTRMADVFVLEAKVEGAIVARTSASDAALGAFGVAAALARQVHQSALEISESVVAQAPGLRSSLFSLGDGGRLELRDLTRSSLSQSELLPALRDWLRGIAAQRPVALSVDDLGSADAESAALLAMLAHEAEQHRVAFAVATDGGGDVAHVAPALAALQEHARELWLGPLSPAEVEQLLASVFGDVPNLQAVSRSLRELSGGRPRECMLLAQSLVDRGLASCEDGAFRLPEHVEAGALPAGLEDALGAALERLGPDARRLAALLSLAVLGRLSHDELSELMPAQHRPLSMSLEELRRAHLLAGDPSGYALCHGDAKRLVLEALTAASQCALHDALADVYEARSAQVAVSAYHRLQGEQRGLGLELLLPRLRDAASRFAFREGAAAALGDRLTAKTLSLALTEAERGGRPLSDRIPVWVTLQGMVARGADPSYAQQMPPDWGRLLRRASGVDDWASLERIADPVARAREAVRRATERFHSSGPQRLVAPTDALGLVVTHAGAAMTLALRTFDRTPLEGIDELLAPLSAIHPFLQALRHQVSGVGFSISGSYQDYARSTRAACALYRSACRDVPAIDKYDAAGQAGIGLLEATLGIPMVEPPERTSQDPNQRVTWELVRKIGALYRGDWQAAESHRRQAELIGLQNNAAPMLPTLRQEMPAHALARDLAGVLALRERARPLARRFSGWVPFIRLANMHVYRLRGEPEKALVEARVIRRELGDCECPPSDLFEAIAVEAELLIERGEPTVALERALPALDQCEREHRRALARALSLAVAQAQTALGEFEAAGRRVAAVIEEQRSIGIAGLLLGLSYEHLARVAIACREVEDFLAAADVVAKEYRVADKSMLAVRYQSLLEDAQKAELAGSAKGRAVGARSSPRSRGGSRHISETLQEELAKLTTLGDTGALGEHALGLLLSAGGLDGWLFLQTPSGFRLCASSRAAEDELALTEYARAQMEMDLQVGTASVTVGEGTELADRTIAASRALADRFYPVVLRASVDGKACVLGIALLVENGEGFDVGGLHEIASSLAADLLHSKLVVPVVDA